MGRRKIWFVPINAKIIDDKYRLNNGDCVEEDNFYPMTHLTTAVLSDIL